MTVAFPYKRLRINRLGLGSRRRLILFVMIFNVVQQCYNKSCEQEQQLPSHVHNHHLPSREGKKNLRSRLRETTATVWLSPGIRRHRTYYSTFFDHSQYIKIKIATRGSLLSTGCFIALRLNYKQGILLQVTVSQTSLGNIGTGYVRTL